MSENEFPHRQASQMKDMNTTRRKFLRGALAAMVAPCIIPASALGADGRPAPSNRITMGFVGVGGQGSGDMGGFMGFPEVQNVAVCDVDSRARLAAKQRAEQHHARERASGTFKGCTDYNDYRELCARPDIDAIFCATPDQMARYSNTMRAMLDDREVGYQLRYMEDAFRAFLEGRDREGRGGKPP